MKIKIVKNPVKFNLAHFIGEEVELDEKMAAELIEAGVAEPVEVEEQHAKPAKKKK